MKYKIQNIITNNIIKLTIIKTDKILFNSKYNELTKKPITNHKYIIEK